MINVSNSVKTDCNSDNLKYKEYILVGGQTVEIRGKMSNSCYNDGNIFGTFIMKKLEFTTENNIDYKGKEVVYYKSVNGESFKIGTYIVTDVTDNDTDETVTVTGYDYGLKTAIPYSTSLNYESGNITLYDVILEACTNSGLTLKNTTITNGNFIVDSNQFVNGELNGDVIKATSQITGDFVTINENDEVELIFEEETNEIIEDYISLDDKRDTQPITVLSLAVSNIDGENVTSVWEEGVLLYGENYLIINDNPFAYTQAKREELITAILNKVKGFSYSSFESSYSFKPYLQLGDKIQFRNKDGNLVDSRILKIDSDFDDITLSAPSIIKATIEYETPESALNIAKRTEIIVNKQTGEIALTSQKITDLTEYIKTKTDTSTILEVTNTISSTGAINNLNIKGFELKHLYCSPYTFCSNTTYCGAQTIYPIMFSSENTFIEPTIVYIISPIPLQKLGSVYDEISISKNKASVIQRLGYEDNVLVELDEAIVHDLGTLQLPTFDTLTYIKIYDFENLIWNCEYIEKNDITNVFTTKIETSAIQTITNDNINLRVEKNKIIAEINLSSEEATISANKISLTATDIINLIAGNAINLTSKNITITSDNLNVDNTGKLTCNDVELTGGTIQSDNYVEDTSGTKLDLADGSIDTKNFKVSSTGVIAATSGTIGNLTIDEYGLTNGTFFIRYDGYSNTYTAADIFIIRAIMLGEPWATITSGTAEFERYDLNSDGAIDAVDLLILRQMLNF